MESFTDGRLVDLALQGDREAIIDVCELIAGYFDKKFINTHFFRGLEGIAAKNSPSEAFNWMTQKGGRAEIQAEARQLLGAVTADVVSNDIDLFYYVRVVLKALIWRNPDEAFKWTQCTNGRRVANMNAFRDWDIQMSVCNLMAEGYLFTAACEIVAETNHYPIGCKSILRISDGITADSDPDLPDDVFPLPVKLGIKQESLDSAKEYFNYLKTKK